MAFVSIDNPAGIQHHGGQMDWCRISPTRIAVVTFTADNKALVQEVNFNADNTELGPASFLKQVTLRSGTQFTYFKPRIKSLGNDRLFIMVAASFVAMPNSGSGVYRLFGSSEFVGINPTIDVPYTHTCMIAVRNADGTYTVDSQIDTRTQSIAEGNGYVCYNTPMDIEINPNGLQIVVNQPVQANNIATRLIMKNTLTLTAGQITAQAVGVSQSFTPQPINTLALGSREVLTPQLVVQRIYAHVSNGVIWANSSNSTVGSICREYWNGAVADLWPALAQNAAGNYLSLNAYLPIDIDAKTFLFTGADAANGNCYLNSSIMSAGIVVRNPLDSAWVTDTVACTIGMAGANVSPNPTTYPTPVFDGDTACSLNPAYFTSNTNAAVRRLSLAFKSIIGAGLYVGPFDPAHTPYYTKDYYNFGPMIHRIDDENFWIIGCFREGEAGVDKLGVITVRA